MGSDLMLVCKAVGWNFHKIHSEAGEWSILIIESKFPHGVRREIALATQKCISIHYDCACADVAKTNHDMAGETDFRFTFAARSQNCW